MPLPLRGSRSLVGGGIDTYRNAYDRQDAEPELGRALRERSEGMPGPARLGVWGQRLPGGGEAWEAELSGACPGLRRASPFCPCPCPPPLQHLFPFLSLPRLTSESPASLNSTASPVQGTSFPTSGSLTLRLILYLLTSSRSASQATFLGSLS